METIFPNYVHNHRYLLREKKCVQKPFTKHFLVVVFNALVKEYVKFNFFYLFFRNFFFAQIFIAYFYLNWLSE